jgi:hypothetical protein
LEEPDTRDLCSFHRGKRLTCVYRKPIIDFRRANKSIAETNCKSAEFYGRSLANGTQTPWTIDHRPHRAAPITRGAACVIARDLQHAVVARAKNIRAPDDFLSLLLPSLSTAATAATAASHGRSGPSMKVKTNSVTHANRGKHFPRGVATTTYSAILPEKRIISCFSQEMHSSISKMLVKIRIIILLF